MLPEDIVNNALEVIGSQSRIASFYDGTPETLTARDMWGQMRDALFWNVEPIWARRETGVTVTKTAPALGYDDLTPWTSAYPDLPWKYQYSVPDECIKPLALSPRITTLWVWRPRPMRFRIKQDASATQYSLLGNDPAPILTYIARILDPNDWHEEFITLAIEAMAKLMMPLFGSKEMMHAVRQQGQQDQSNANSGG